jgi:diguanylate cyclase (GGDEF)-like protein
MSEMRELLQSCTSIREIPSIVVVSIGKLFPRADGALFLMNDSRNDLQSIARWGDFPDEADENIFEPDACWALRRGRIHEVEDVEIGPICPHLKHPPFAPYMCLPLIAKGDILGLLHLRIKPSRSGEDRWNTVADLKETVVIFAEYLSLSIANIRLWERLTDQSIRDPLTGLFNRRYMEQAVQREILRAAQNQTKIGIIMADIDHFKSFNDKHGHEAGDELLIKIADFFKYEIRGSDTACRYGGEEFILILPGASTEGTYKRAEHIREQVKNLRAYFRDRMLPSITLSMGIATYPDHGTELNDLIQVADTALYKAKEQGRDRTIKG